MNTNNKNRIWAVLITLISFCSNLLAYQVEAENIPSNRYSEITFSELTHAKTSIEVYMYLMSYFPGESEGQSGKLIEALAEAQKRGVAVKVVLDQNIDFTEEAGRDDTAYQNKNQAAYEYLKRNNVPVFFDSADTYTHAKAIIIDEETVILGSTNWSKAALTRNNEANALIRSKEFAQNLLNDLRQTKLQENIPASLTPSVPIPKDFLTNKNLLSEMATHSDERAFDVYLYLIKEFNCNAEGKLTLDYDNLAKSIGIDQMSIEDYRRQINKVLDKLQAKYKLIKFESPKRNQDTEIRLSNSITQAEEKLEIPTSFWRYGWNNTLSFPAKVMYLVNLSYSRTAPQGRFSISRETLSKTHGISESFITDGNQELRRLNLLDIHYSDMEDLKFSKRQPNSYAIQELYDPKELATKLKSLEQKHGKEKLNRAVQTASLVFEENNLKAINALLELEDQYGQNTVEEAAKKIAEKNPDNPKRSAGYLFNTIKSIGGEKARG